MQSHATHRHRSGIWAITATYFFFLPFPFRFLPIFFYRVDF